MRHLLVGLCCTLALFSRASGKVDWTEIDKELSAAIASKTTNDSAFSGKLTEWMRGLGVDVRIDHPRENSVYTMGFIMLASATDAEIQELRKSEPMAKTKEDFLRQNLEKNRVDAVAFERALWNAKDHPNPRQRYRLLKGYVMTNPPAGRTQDEVEADLGPASSDESGFSYSLGANLGIGIDTLSVVFALRDGKVSHWNFTSD